MDAANAALQQDTVDGQSLLRRMPVVIVTGSGVSFPSQYLDSFKLTAVFVSLTSAPSAKSFLTSSRAPLLQASMRGDTLRNNRSASFQTNHTADGGCNLSFHTVHGRVVTTKFVALLHRCFFCSKICWHKYDGQQQVIFLIAVFLVEISQSLASCIEFRASPGLCVKKGYLKALATRASFLKLRTVILKLRTVVRLRGRCTHGHNCCRRNLAINPGKGADRVAAMREPQRESGSDTERLQCASCWMVRSSVHEPHDLRCKLGSVRSSDPLACGIANKSCYEDTWVPNQALTVTNSNCKQFQQSPTKIRTLTEGLINLNESNTWPDWPAMAVQLTVNTCTSAMSIPASPA